MRVLLWNHRFDEIAKCPDWNTPYRWITESLTAQNIEVYRHPGLRLRFDVETSASLTAADLVIYSHTTARHVRGFDGPQWFVKSTGPGKFHTTLDPLGYGPYSSITYEKPPFDQVSDEEVERFFEEEAGRWGNTGDSKWGKGLFGNCEVPFEEYILVLTQTLRDETVTNMFFGDYLNSLKIVIHSLALTTDLPIVVKIHPWTDPHKGFVNGQPVPSGETAITESVLTVISAISPKVHCFTGFTSVHSFFPRARAVVLCNSGAGIEALLHKKPIISWGFPEYHWVTYDLRHACDMERALSLEWVNQQAADRFTYWYVTQYCLYSYESAVRRVSELLDKLN